MRSRQKISVTVDPSLLAEVDLYVREHENTDRSRVIDEALRCWAARQLEADLLAQHGEPEPAGLAAEREAWKQIRSAQVPYLMRKYGQREGDE
ncbi:MAG TPA: ribbon-helix-helix domain-containing protein [Chloroflexota bacterium]